VPRSIAVTARARLWLFAVPAVAVGVLLVWSFAGLPSFGHYRGPYGDIINAIAGPQRHTTHPVAAVNFDYRGFDTIGEEFILFASVIGVSALLRVQRREHELPSPPEDAAGHPAPEIADSVAVICMGLVAPFVLLGLYIVVHGHLTPGGGFQGGVILAAALLMVYLAGRYVTFRQLSPKGLIDAGEGLGAGGFVLVGFAGMVAGAAFLENILPLGQTGKVFSAGTLPVINVLVGLGVGMGVLLVIWEFLEQALMVRG
jgi:multicomponent Na+:H+ antiporter subunit B